MTASARKALMVWAWLLMVLQPSMSYGEVTVDRTRVIYPAAAREVTVNLTHTAQAPRLVKVWIDEGDAEASPEASDVPFTLNPPVFRMEAGSGRALRVVYHPSPRALRREEQVYWLNVLGIRPEVSSTEQVNTLQFALRTRIKLFLRPTTLTGKASEAVGSLQWQLNAQERVLAVNNPTDYHITLASILLTSGGKDFHSEDPPMIAPRSAAEVAVPGLPGGVGRAPLLRFTTLDDNGATQHHEAPLSIAE
ncbi:molecular chaperone [Pseudomonas sp. P7548]|uniref:fimbrial biogenesis chaperone n=1 Tax=Pseudomonas sp. P7548 TaxID=2726981 RepID=UPI0015BF45DF|nr:molecular chaperone [Pseudomonas sp. P7548]NWE19967.1 molecular chaperone [Pseudomonas sp. P7548]